MDTPPENGSNLADATKRVLWRLNAIGHNRAELLMVEMQEQNERLHVTIFLSCAIGFLGLMGAITLTAVIALTAGLHFLVALVILAIIYIGGAVFCYIKLARLLANWEAFPHTREQLKKDRECFENSPD
jgi:uncharacterized membrane protein YqjE